VSTVGSRPYLRALARAGVRADRDERVVLVAGHTALLATADPESADLDR